MNREIEFTADGSSTIYIPEMDEHYHSVKGALTESCHIYRDCGLKYCSKKEVRVLEIGLGTGLNAVVSAIDDSKGIEYFGIELYPLSGEILDKMKYNELLGEEGGKILSKIHNSKWGLQQEITPKFKLTKLNIDYTAPGVQLPQNIDVVYFDAFAPEKQPEMWSVESFFRLYECMNDEAILTTYCAKGEIRRRLQQVGFTVERIAGPIGGKREILRAIKSKL